jgi:predicted phosphoribosyltransferase
MDQLRTKNMFHDREQAGHDLALALSIRHFHDPLVLAIPRGGIVIGAVLARELGADLDVILSRKLRAPAQPELAIGAVSEDGKVYLNDYGRGLKTLDENYLLAERDYQLAEIARRKQLIRTVRPPAPVGGRSVIVTDDGIATGATMHAALRKLGSQKVKDLIVAVPVAAPDRLREIRLWCDDLFCLLAPEGFRSVGQFYEDFRPVEDAQAVELLREFSRDKRQQRAFSSMT